MTLVLSLDELLTCVDLPPELLWGTDRALLDARRLSPATLGVVLQGPHGPTLQRWAMALHLPDAVLVTRAAAVQGGLLPADVAACQLRRLPVRPSRCVALAAEHQLVDPRALDPAEAAASGSAVEVDHDEALRRRAEELLTDALCGWRTQVGHTPRPEAVTVLFERWMLVAEALATSRAKWDDARSMRAAIAQGRGRHGEGRRVAAADRFLIGADTRKGRTASGTQSPSWPGWMSIWLDPSQRASILRHPEWIRRWRCDLHVASGHVRPRRRVTTQLSEMPVRSQPTVWSELDLAS